MSVSLLYKPGSTQLGLILGGVIAQLGGAGSVLLRPDVGQYWLPNLVHVSTRNGKPCRVDLCSGSIGALTAGNKDFRTNGALSDPTTIKDFTSLGANDTSTILSGTIISPGEGIQVNFYNGLGADVGFVEIWGSSSDVPPLIGTGPLIPGVRFTGSTNSGETPVAAPTFLLFQWPAGFFAPGTINAAASNLDMRGYSSYQLAVTAVKPGFTSPNIDSVTARIDWFSQDGGFIYSENYSWYADDRGGVAVNQNFGTLEIHDAVHGEFMNVSITNNAGNADNIQFQGEIRGSVRLLGRPYVRNAISTAVGSDAGIALADTTIFASAAGGTVIGAGASTDTLLPLRPGQAHLWINSTAAGIRATFVDAVSGHTMYQFTTVVGNNDYRFIMPSSSVRLNLQNTTGANITVFAQVTVEQPAKGT